MRGPYSPWCWSPARIAAALYCVSGSVFLPEYGLPAGAGEFLLCREDGEHPVRLTSREGAELMAAAIYTR